MILGPHILSMDSEVVNKHTIESDITSAAKALRKFNVKEDEYINIWLKEYEMICIDIGLNEF